MRTLTPVDMISKEEAARLNEEVKSRLSASVTAHDEFRRLSKQYHVVHIEMYTLYIPAELWGGEAEIWQRNDGKYVVVWQSSGIGSAAINITTADEYDKSHIGFDHTPLDRPFDRYLVNEHALNLYSEIYPHRRGLEILRSLEKLYETAQQELIQELRTTNQAAEAWNITPEHAAEYITQLHERYGAGFQLGGSWIIRQSDIDAHAHGYRSDEEDEKDYE